LSWTTVSGAASYNIYRSIASDAEGLPVLANTTSTSYTDNAASGTYYYRVTAKGQNGDETLGSNEVSATP
jgi:fibronectin type 3 domain-containing protein